MKLKHLESALSSVSYQFDEPNIRLEQYPTSPHLAAAVALAARDRGDLGDDVIACDLGCGTGMLSLAAGLVGCTHVIAVDCDESALKQAARNVEGVDIMDLRGVVDFILAELRYVPSSSSHHQHGDGRVRYKGRNHHPPHRGKGRGRDNKGKGGQSRAKELQAQCPPTSISDQQAQQRDGDGIPLASKSVDTVLINPPFGTKHNAGIDMSFLACGCRLSRGAVYSFHKKSTRKYVLKTATEEWGMGAEVIAEMRFDIPNMYKFHKQKSVDIEVDLVRLWHLDDDSSGNAGEEEGEGNDVVG